ncbi:MAG: AAA family ATPase [Dysgonamonadaceae bacterium]|nr:AAA family ATPase [Dysgonamonadaceae bacterium]
MNDIYYFLFDDLLIYVDPDRLEVTFFYRKTDIEQVDKIAEEFQKFKRRKIRDKPEIKLLTTGHSGLSTTFMSISKPKFSIEDNYNDDFLPVHQIILQRLSKKNDKGLVLLHGKPGTGKTSYIRYLITNTKKDVIFLPPNMAASITDPGLMNILIHNPNSIFVIEDAENIIIDRNRAGSSSVSALLNLADGLLSDCLNIQIICSFNTDLSRVDSALMRKGRLIAKYEFSELEVHKAQALSDKLGFSSIITSPMTLAAVYNQNETEFAASINRKPIGFNVAV